MKTSRLFFVMGLASVFLVACSNGKPAQNNAQTQQTQESTQQTSFPEVSFAPPSYRADYGNKTLAVTVEKLADGYEPGVATTSGEAGPTKSAGVSSSKTSPSMPAESLWYTDSGAYSGAGTGASSAGSSLAASGSSGSSGSTTGEGFHPFHGLTEPGTNIPVYPNGSSNSLVTYRCPNPDIYTPPSPGCMPSQPFHGLHD